MKKNQFIILLGLLAACNSQPKEKETEGQAEQPSNTKQTINCYQYATAADTVRLTLVHVGGTITGMLLYQLKDKDMNAGSIKGTMKGDILVADYTFKSEGTVSTRQVAFKKNGNTFTEGYGESVDVNGVEKFKNIDSLDFPSSMKLQEIPCN